MRLVPHVLVPRSPGSEPSGQDIDADQGTTAGFTVDAEPLCDAALGPTGNSGFKRWIQA